MRHMQPGTTIMAANEKKKPSVKKVGRTGKAPKKGMGGAVELPPEVVKAILTILRYLTPSANVNENLSDKVPCDCPNPCQDVPAGEIHVLVCDGQSGQPFSFPGTANGQVLAWDQTTKKVYWSNV